MSARYVVMTVGAVLFFGVLAWAVLTGMGPAPGSSADVSIDRTYEETVVVSGEGADGDGMSANDAGSGEAPFTLDVVRTTDCGTTCRDVTVTLVNRQESRVEDVVVRTVIATGERRVWQGSEEVGDLAPGESETRTQRVRLTYAEAFRVYENGGWITIRTYIHTEGTTYVFEDRRRVGR